MSLRLVQLCAALLLVSAASAQILYCPLLSFTTKYVWNPSFSPTINVHTVVSGSNTYPQNFNCNFEIEATIAGRVVVQVLDSDLSSFSASISIRTSMFSGYMADWNQLTYNVDRHSKFVSNTNKLFITINSQRSPIGLGRGVRLQLTFLRPDDCLPGWTSVSLAGASHCVGRPTAAILPFGEAQRYCNLQRSNLLVSDRDNVSSVLGRSGASNCWIGMTAEPNSYYSASVFRWLNKAQVESRQFVSCTGYCVPGSTKHRCVYAATAQSLVQENCDTNLQPLCYMPAGGTDNFFAGSTTTRASGLLLTVAGLLFWSLR